MQSLSSSSTGAGGGGKKAKTKSVSFASLNETTSQTSNTGLNGSENLISDHQSGVVPQGGVSYNDGTSSQSQHRQGNQLGLTNKISIEELSKLSDDDVFVDSSIIDYDELTGEQVIEEMQSHLHQLRLRQFMSEVRQARLSAKQLTEIATAKSELSAEFEETLQIESARHNEELLKMDKQRQELLDKVTPIRLKIAAASAAAATATASSVPVSDSTSSADSSSSGDSTSTTSINGDEKPIISVSATLTTGESGISQEVSPSSPVYTTSSSSAVGGGGTVNGSTETSSFLTTAAAAATSTDGLSSTDYSATSGSSSLEITVRERHEEVLYSRRLDLLDQRQKDEVQRNADHIKEAQENFDVKTRRLAQREKEVREAFSARVEKGRSELILQIEMVCNRDSTHTSTASTSSSSSSFITLAAETSETPMMTTTMVAWPESTPNVASDSHSYVPNTVATATEEEPIVESVEGQ
jgi:hypothetical protein